MPVPLFLVLMPDEIKQNHLALFISFHGRIGLKVWWIAQLSFAALLVLAATLELMLDTGRSYGALFDGFVAICTWPMLALQTKRWHDRGKSGWWCLINFIPYVGTLWAFIELGFFGSKEAGNKY